MPTFVMLTALLNLHVALTLTPSKAEVVVVSSGTAGLLNAGHIVGFARFFSSLKDENMSKNAMKIFV
jgi:hypothetical protein